jgi:hypothetical protein
MAAGDFLISFDFFRFPVGTLRWTHRVRFQGV